MSRVNSDQLNKNIHIRSHLYAYFRISAFCKISLESRYYLTASIITCFVS